LKKNFLKISTIACLIVVALFVAGLSSASVSGPTGPTVKNVILLIGDGMGPAHVNLTRLCLGVDELVMEELDETGPSYMTTYCLRADGISHGITDSAAAGSAMATGYKTYYYGLSVDINGNPVETVLERAEMLGKATGLVTDVYLQDATPAVFAAHRERRGDSANVSVQMGLEHEVEVLMGAGEGWFLPKGHGSTGGQRTDGRNLIEEMEDNGYVYVDSAKEMANVEIDITAGDKLLGLFGGLYNMDYDLDRQLDKKTGVPTLVEMTVKALEIVSQDPDGFFLMVEGGALDWVAHDRDVAGVVTETATFDEAVQIALDFAEEDGETLVVVTADHECGTLYMTPDSVTTEPPTYVPIDEEALDCDFIMGITATTGHMWGEIIAGADIEETVLTYTGYELNPAEVDLINGAGKYGQLIISDILSARAGVEWGYEGTDDGDHTYATVPIYAYGPNAERFDDVTDNTEFGQELFVAVCGYWPT
jgi:alkaline phosphatase